MGWGCSVIAGNVMDALVAILQKEKGNDAHGGSNTWMDNGDACFFETGKEQSDGAITGTVRRASKRWNLPTDGPDVVRAKNIGGIRIEPHGVVTRWPTSTADQRKRATEKGRAEFARVYGQQSLAEHLSRHET